MIYLDNNATTQAAPEVLAAMTQVQEEDWANPSSVHRFGQQARHRVDEAREQIASLLGCAPRNLIFTSGATESCNLALRGILAARAPRRTILTTRLEHAAVRESCHQLETEGCGVVWLPVSAEGLVDPEQLGKALDDHEQDAALVAVHWINNETGAIQPMAAIGEACRARGVPLFSDATQAIGKVPCDMSQLPVDAMACSAHKLHGPKGTGVLALARRMRLAPQILGGPQEAERRGGTENVPGIVGMGVAAELAKTFLAGDGPQEGAALRDRLEEAILKALPEAVVNSSGAPRIWNTTNIGFPPLESEAILLLLSEQGVSAAAGAACSSGSLEPSPVLLAQGISEPVAHGSVRFSISRFTTQQEIAEACRIIPQAVLKLRQSLPVG